jgi:hypothetical protein
MFTAGFLALAAIGMAAQDSVAIQRTLVENSVEKYKSTTKIVETLNSPIGDIPLNISTTTTYSLKTKKVDAAKGLADVEFTSTIDSIDGGDSPLTEGWTNKKPDPMVQQGTIDRLGHLDLKAPDKPDKDMAIIAGISGSLQASTFVELPQHPVKVGDSWDITVPKGDYTGDTDQKISAKLTGDKKVDGKDAWTVELSGSINLQFDSAKFASAGSSSNGILDKHHITGTGVSVMKGSALVEKSTGKTLSLDANNELKASLQMDADVKAQTTGTVVTSLKLQPDDPAPAAH